MVTFLYDLYSIHVHFYLDTKQKCIDYIEKWQFMVIFYIIYTFLFGYNMIV